MFKQIYKIIISILIYWVFTDNMAGVITQHGMASKLIGGLFFGLIMLSLPEILRFFKFPVSLSGKFLVGSILTIAYLLLLDAFFPQIFKAGPGYVGNMDFIIFTIPRLLTLGSPILVILFSAIMLVLCSIILEKLK